MSATQRRIGERYDVGELAVTWTPRVVNQWSRRVLLARATQPAVAAHPTDQAWLLNVSITGAGVVANADEALVPDTIVKVGLGREAGFVGRICRVLPTGEPQLSYFGLEYVEFDERFEAWLNLVVAEHRRATQAH